MVTKLVFDFILEGDPIRGLGQFWPYGSSPSSLEQAISMQFVLRTEQLLALPQLVVISIDFHSGNGEARLTYWLVCEGSD